MSLMSVILGYDSFNHLQASSFSSRRRYLVVAASLSLLHYCSLAVLIFLALYITVVVDQSEFLNCLLSEWLSPFVKYSSQATS